MTHMLRAKRNIEDIRHAYDEDSVDAVNVTVKQDKPRKAIIHQSDAPHIFTEKPIHESPAASLISTIASNNDLVIDTSPVDAREVHTPSTIDAIPATPHDFSTLFPSNRQLLIRHDNSAGDGEMNFRVDTEVKVGAGASVLMSLFHLRLQGVEDRQFSLRRYCRDSGREVCHSVRNPGESTKRPGLQRSLSHALSSMRSKIDHRTSSGTMLKRNDSGYGSMHSSSSYDDRPMTANAVERQTSPPDVVRLEFSNYAQVDVRHGGTVHARYDFEYWGKQYAWRQDSKSDDSTFHLFSPHKDHSLGYIMPLSNKDADEQHTWVAPAVMSITDEQVLQSQKDLSDVIVAAGLLALVDTAIRSYSDDSHSHSILPRIQYIGPKRFLKEVLRPSSRRSNSQSRPSSSSHERPEYHRTASMRSRGSATT